jgi:hypothetical protein
MAHSYTAPAYARYVLMKTLRRAKIKITGFSPTSLFSLEKLSLSVYK